jgi:hypothetical protein
MLTERSRLNTYLKLNVAFHFQGCLYFSKHLNYIDVHNEVVVPIAPISTNKCIWSPLACRSHGGVRNMVAYEMVTPITAGQQWPR